MGVKRSRSNSFSSIDAPSSPSARESSVDVKIVHLDADSGLSAKTVAMKCSLPPHQPMTFGTFEEYDVHYQKVHTHRCSECHKNFPDEHFLHLHIEENHDPIKAALREKGEKTYSCLLPTCPRLCLTPRTRRLHCIDAHDFPRTYDFFIINDGIDRRSSMLRAQRRRPSTLDSTRHVGNASGGNSDEGKGRKGRKRSSTVTSGVMDIVVDDGDGEDGEAREEGKEEDDEGVADADDDNAKTPPHLSPTSPTRTIKLGGRGGIGLGRSIPRQRTRTPQASTSTSTADPLVESSKTTAPADDAMEGLASRMSALQFVPHSVRMAQGRGRGRGSGHGRGR
ncbi:uncharacterized protein EI97DRAFT_462664 [Westerdykella ornata]|uniref:C2H2-type domain-containing protein n=1 Tax=Westerdykella ornata TaxID=318751 RepID=A0A6A6J5W8_WESOR|nr:uncharacterized protein EI97DRAFT_462664 [Westerdykella ornata]KAF2271614.1 hypothetical protein EI97DRAFT_462664 [Westerdykella ornata]